MAVIPRNLGFRQQIQWVFAAGGLLLLIELVNLFSGRYLNDWGLIPRQVSSLGGIIAAPLLHGSLLHFLSNIIPFMLLSFCLLQHGFRRYLGVTLWIIMISGIAIWLFGRSAIHIGASGLIYGYFSYLVVAGFLSKAFKLLAIALLVGIAYSGLLFGILPTSRYISWESHLAGLLAGLWAAFLWRTSNNSKANNKLKANS